MLDHKYHIFYRLAQNPNTTQIAEEMHLSQPAISKNIQEMEKELGITLFHREKGRLRLTDNGTYLYAELVPLIKKEREILFHLGQMRDNFKGTIHIGASTTLSQYILPEILARFTNRYPDININFISGNTRQIEQDILNDSLHLAFIEGTPSQTTIRYIPYLQDEIVLVCAEKSKIPETLTQEQLSDYPFIFREKGSGTYDVIKKQLEKAGTSISQLNVQLILGTTEGIKQYLYNSNALAFLSVYSIRHELAARRLRIIDIDGLTITRTLYAIHRQGEPDPYARLFLDFTLNHLPR